MSGFLKKMITRGSAAVLLAGIGVGVLGMLGYDYAMTATGTDEFCTGCHEMESGPFALLKESTHFSNESGVRPGCSDCHLPATGLPKIWRKIQASREVWGHVMGTIDTPEKYLAHAPVMKAREIARLKANDSQECRNCHEVAAMDFEQQSRMAKRSHSKMPTSGKTCIDCHEGIAHESLPELHEAGDK